MPGDISELMHETAAQAKLSPRTGLVGRSVTTAAVGGPLSAVFEPETAEQLAALVRALGDLQAPYRVLGAGSNLLIDDAGCSDAIVRLGRGFRGITPRGAGIFEVGGAAALMTVSRSLSNDGFSGLEFAGGIPASLGGAVRMNAGAHGGQMADVVTSVTVVVPSGEIVELTPAELAFRYRHSTLPAGAIVVKAVLKLVSGDGASIEKRRAELLARRKATQPLTVPSFGSVFKNPSLERSAGALIEGAGLKGRTLGGAAISTVHANWIVNPERTASAADVRGLIDLCRREVEVATSLNLEPEVVLW